MQKGGFLVFHVMLFLGSVSFLGAPHFLSPGCGGSGNATGSSDPQFESGPIVIPITIAKGITGIDASSLAYDVATQTLSGHTIDNVDGTIIGYVNGVEVFRIETTGGAFEITGITPPIVVALTVLNEDETVVEPVIVSISEDDVVSVSLTNIGGIRHQAGLFVGEEIIFFCADAIDEAGGAQTVIAGVPINGGEAAISEIVERCPVLHGRDGSQGGVIVTSDSTSGEIRLLGDDSYTLHGTTESTDPIVALSEEGWGIPFSADAENKQISLNGSILSIPSDGTDIDSQLFGWLDDSTLVSYQNGPFRAQECDVNTQTCIGNVAYGLACSEISCGGGNCLMVCEDGTGENDAVIYNGTDDLMNVLSTENYSDMRFCDSVMSVGSIDAAENGDCDSEIAGLVHETLETVRTGTRGCKPRCHPSDGSLTVHFMELEGTIQISVVPNGIL